MVKVVSVELKVREVEVRVLVKVVSRLLGPRTGVVSVKLYVGDSR